MLKGSESPPTGNSNLIERQDHGDEEDRTWEALEQHLVEDDVQYPFSSKSKFVKTEDGHQQLMTTHRRAVRANKSKNRALKIHKHHGSILFQEEDTGHDSHLIGKGGHI